MDHNKKPNTLSQDEEVRKGPWTMEEDLILINYIATHGEGVWNSLAKAAGLKRTGKSCRLRWLNYLRPDVRRGNITPEEQLLIMELHAKWGNRWSKIAKHLPGRTDNEIKNFWRTRIQKQLKQSSNNNNINKGILSTSCDHLMNHPASYVMDSQGQSSNQTNGPSTSQMSTSATTSECRTSQAPDPYGSASSYHEPNMEGYFPMASSSCGGGAAASHHDSMFPTPPLISSSSLLPPPPPQFSNCPTVAPEASDNFWGVDELWSMQFFNGD